MKKTAKTTENKVPAKEAIVRKYRNTEGVLIRPIVTEKSGNLSQMNQYVFEIPVDSNKIRVAQAFETKYKIKPISVNISKVLGSYVRRGKTFGKTKDRKKAMVTLPQGKTINIAEIA